MRRHCARPGCSSRATATFTFNAHERAVWLDTPRDGAPSAGELCDRHARALTPPHGWTVDDRRHASPAPHEHAAPTVEPVEPVEPAARAETPEIEHAMRSTLVPTVAAVPVAESPVREELRQLLDVHSPLLARAFRSAGEV